MKKDRICAALLAALELLMIMGMLLLTGWMIRQYIEYGQQAASTQGDHAESGKAFSDDIKKAENADSGNAERTGKSDSVDAEKAVEENTAVQNPSIRVRLLTQDYQSEYHDRIELTCSTAYSVTWFQKTDGAAAESRHLILQAEELFSIEQQDLGADEFLQIEARAASGKSCTESLLRITSFTRADGYPEYAGTLSVYPEEEGLILINELPLETYLCGVVSSEMPSWYPLEAQKAQAVCARTYAWRQMERSMEAQNSGADDEEKLTGNTEGNAAENAEENVTEKSTPSADLDDSVMYQVYNNYRSSDLSEEAVRLTAGEILSVEEPLYYSTSCLSECRSDLSEEEAFAEFLAEVPKEQEEYGSSWLRWEAALKKSDILEQVIKYYPEFAQKATASETQSDEEQAASLKLEVLERSDCGQVQRLLARCGGAEQIVEGEYLIRCVLGTQQAEILLMDGSIIKNMQLLPSAFFILGEQNGTESDTISLSGGGYGHGTGMSQCGAAQMASEGSDYQEILAYYYGEEAEVQWRQ